jgi:hypothetical protein
MKREKTSCYVPIGYSAYDLAKRVLSGRGVEPTKQEIARFLAVLVSDAVDSVAEKVLGISADSPEALWGKLHGYWVGVCGMAALRKSVPADADSLARLVNEHGVDRLIEAMDNFSRVYHDKRQYAWVDRMEFDEFIVRGYLDFLTEADPFNRYRRVTAGDFAKIQPTVKRIGYKLKVGKRELNKLRRVLEGKIGRLVVGRDFDT